MPFRFARLPRASALVFLVSACAPGPVDWNADRAVRVTDPFIALVADGRLVPDSLYALALRIPPPAPACPGTLRLARAGRRTYAVWWSPRADSTARLLVARSADGGATWSAIAPVDTADRGATGCTRAAAAIAADSASGYVHVTYAMLAPEGPGLFFAHSMDGGATFHSPVPILYGARLGRTSVAASGNLVAVAFEDPNSRIPRVGLALSRTMGHIFEQRLLPVSEDNGAATHPLVAIQGRLIAVAWQERAAETGGVVLRVRSGVLH